MIIPELYCNYKSFPSLELLLFCIQFNKLLNDHLTCFEMRAGTINMTSPQRNKTYCVNRIVCKPVVN